MLYFYGSPSLRSFNMPSPSFTLFVAVLLWMFLFDPSATTANAKEKILFAKSSEIVEMTADSLIMEDNGNRAILQGNVKVGWGDYKLSGDRVYFEKETMTTEAEGNIRFEDSEGNTLECDAISLDLNSQTGVVINGTLTLREDGYRIWGDKFLKTGPSTYEVEGGGFTACDGSWPSWRVEADRVSVQIEGYLAGWGASMWMENMPLVYSPYIVFPVKRNRQSGFLIPKIGYSNANGASWLIRHYWTMSESADLTARLGYQSRRGWTEGAEFRYSLAQGHGGRLDASHLFDRKEDFNRYTVDAEHSSRFSDATKLDVKIDYQGDDKYLKDLGETLDDRGRERLESFALFQSGGDGGSLFFLSEYTQSLDAPHSSSLRVLPSLGFIGREVPLVGPLYFNPTMKAVNFWREEGDRGGRLELNPTMSLDSGFGGFGLSARAGYRQNIYRTEGEVSARGASFAETGISAPLARVYGEYIHAMEPSAIFSWTEAGRGGEPPLFDNADRFENNSSLIFSLESRLLRRLDLSQAAALDIERSYSVSDEEWREWRSEISLTPSDNFSFNADGEYDQDLRDPWLRWSAFFEGRDSRGDRVFVGKRHYKDVASYADFGAQAALNDSISLQYRNRYSFKDHRALEESYGLLVNHSCWELNISFSRNIMSDEDRDERRYYATLQLKGLGKIGKLKGIMP